MTEPENNTVVTDKPATTPPGKQLREAREARGLTLAETAIKLHLHQRMLSALEADDYDQLPSPIYVRGYLRNYARLLGLNPEHIVAAYEGNEDEHPELKPPLKPPSQMSSSDKPVKAVTYLLTLVLALLLLAWWQSRNVNDDGFLNVDNLQSITTNDDKPPVGNGVEEQAQVDRLGYPVKIIHHPDTAFYPPLSSTPARPSITGSANAAQAAPADTATTPAELLETMPDLDDGGIRASETAATGVDAAGRQNDQAPAAAAADAQGLRLELNDKSWIEVHDANGKRLYQGLAKPGEVIQVDGRTPLRVLLGYAPGVVVHFNGEPIETIEHSQAGVARFTVGQ